METHNIDTYIYMKSVADQTQQDNVVKTLRNTTGIAMVNPHPKIKRLIEVSYDPAGIDLTSIIHTIDIEGGNPVIVGM